MIIAYLSYKILRLTYRAIKGAVMFITLPIRFALRVIDKILG